MTPTTTAATPALDQLLTPDGRRYYGVALTVIGDNGDWIVAAGHIEPRRMAAAAQAAGRDLTGERRLFLDVERDESTLTHALDQIDHTWAVLRQPWCDNCRYHDDEDSACAASADWGLDWNQDTPSRDVPITVLDWQ